MKLLSKLILTLALATYVSANESFRYVNWDNPPHDVTFYEGDILQFTTDEGRNSTITLISDNENGDKSFDGVLNEGQRSFVQKPLPPGKYTFQDLNSGSKSIIRVKESKELAKEVRPIDRLKDNADAANNENAQKSPNSQKGSPKSDAKEASPKTDTKEASPKSDAKEASPKTDTKQGSTPKTDTKSTTQKPSSSSDSKAKAETNTAANNEEAEHVEKGASNTLKASLSIISAACVLSLGYLL
ncbi:hypothetical protein ACTFIZ_011163 [Dictyostelium cf. discoideum]